MHTCPQCGASYYPNTVVCESCGTSLWIVERDSSWNVSGLGPSSGPPRVVVFEIPTSGRVAKIEWKGEPLLLGRADCSTDQIPALDLSEDGGVDCGVSRRHARLLLQDEQLLLEDLNSANGTWVNEVRLQPNQPIPVHHGDLISLGRLSIRVNLLAGR